MPSARINDCNLYYELAGSGPDVVFLHGEDHGIEMFEDVIAQLSPRFRCLAYYRRGHGKSELPPYGYSVRCQMLDLAGLLDHLGVRRTAVVAVAMSTSIAAAYTVAHPERVRALVLSSWYELDGYPKMEERRRPKYKQTFAQLHMQMHALVRDGGPQALIDYAERERDRFLPILPKDDAARARVMRMMASHPPEHYIKAAEFYTSMTDMVPALRTVRCPILGICGEDDPSPDRPDLVGGTDFREVWIPGARRFTMMERPREFGAALEQFLDSLPA